MQKPDVDDAVGWGEASVTEWVIGYPGDFEIDHLPLNSNIRTQLDNGDDDGWGGGADQM
ncbi:hypothetical protein GP486_004543 [Trichoglossum hirsutum]|uniref:Uncharacterized protein n=1 Tax=Trichoglossum hirsutum TaxID=265104 RepID=A0A9P8LAY9_9PEZI|nr:hypothetical protein GP486_004543 [Trichoglossum hirsutum]